MADSTGSSGRSSAPTGQTGSGRRASLTSGGSGRRKPVEAPVEDPAAAEQQQAVGPKPRSGRRPPLPVEADAAAVVSQDDQPPEPTASEPMAPRATFTGTRSTRRGGIEGASSARRRAQGVGKELMICFGVIGVLAVAAVVIFFIQNARNSKIKDQIRIQNELFEKNMRLGFDSYKRAENAGLLFVMKGEATTDDKLFGPFKSDEKIYNILYDRMYKDKKNKDQREQKAMFKDRLKIETMERAKGAEENGVSVGYGFAEERATPLVIAKKFIKPAPGDNANLGGTITVIAKAEWDHIFESAKNQKAAVEKDKAAAEKDKAEKKE